MPVHDRAAGTKEDTSMAILRYTKIISTEDGASAFVDDELHLASQQVAESTPPMFVGNLASAGAMFLRSSAFDSGFHPAPRSQWVVVLRGSLEISVSNGSTRRFTAGDLFLIEDTSGQGHATTGVGEGLFLPVDSASGEGSR